MKVIDALGVACPGPVVAAKKELEEGKKEGFQILVDNQIAVDNLRKFASSQNCEFAYTRLEEKKYEVHIVPTDKTKLSSAKMEEEQPQEVKPAGQGTVVVLCSNKMGEGDEALGKILIKGYIYALTQLEELPKTVLMYNSGVFLACEGSESLEDLKTLESKTLEDGFWNDSKKSGKVLQEIKVIKNKKDKYLKLESELSNLEEMNELLQLEDDEALVKELLKNTSNIQKEIENLEIETLLSGKYDINNAIVTIHPGAGGTESQDWAEMLYRMYTRWANANNYSVKELDYLDGDEAGLKSVTFLISGDYAYGYMKCEKGVHRLVRISPFDAGGRRHTSFASVEVLPEITEDIEIDINPDDLRIDTYRASGAGGQHINKTSSAVRITHIPTNTVVACQTERSQIQNRETAMKMLKSKLLNLKEQEQKEKIEDLKGEQKDIAWGSQIRSYVFCPYTLVKDHRTNYEVGNVQAVMDGDLNEFMKSYLKSLQNEK